MATTVLARKWRPKNFSQLTGQEHVIKALGNALSQNRLHHAYLFTGTRGVGKTTIARIFAKSLNCETGVTATPCGECQACLEIDAGRFIDLIELDAASNTQVDSMRELLETALYAPNNARFKVYIIDEVHMLSKAAFNAMLKTLEEPPAHVKFILATTDPQKIPITVLSRCLQFNLKQLAVPLISSRLQYVLQQENITFELAAVQLIARAAQGSMRDALSLTDQAIAFSAGNVAENVVRNMLGAIDRDYLFSLFDALYQQDGVTMLEIADSMATRSVAFDAALQEMASLLHRISLIQTVPQAIAEEDLERPRLLALAEQFSAADLQLYYQIAIHGRNEIELAPDEYAGFTMTLLRMLAFSPSKTPAVAQGGSAPPPSVMPRTPAPNPMPATVEHAPSPVAAATITVAELPAVLATTEVADEVVAEENTLETAAEILESATLAIEQDKWATLMQALNLNSMAQQLARNCTLESIDDNQITLCLTAEQRHLRTKMAEEKLQSAFSDYFAKPIHLKIVHGQSDAATPAAIEQHIKDVKQQQANQSIAQDSFVREAQVEFDAIVVTESIKSIV